MERHLLAHLLGDLVQIAAVSLGENHIAQPGRVRGKDFLFQAADRKHAPLKRHLTGHADVVPDGPAAHQRGKRGGHRDPGARAVLGDRARRHVKVKLAILEAVLRDPELIGVAADIGEGDSRRLLHHVSQLTGEDEALLAGHRGRLDEEHVAAGACDREAGCHARNCRAVDRLLKEPLAAKCAP